MKTLKIIIGLFIAYAMAKEYIDSSRHFQNYFEPGILIAVSLILIVPAAFIGAGMAKEPLKFFSRQFLMYYLIAWCVFLLLAFLARAIGINSEF